MSSREERPGSWRTDVNDLPDAGSAERDAILESLATPLPPEIERDRDERTDVAPSTAPRRVPDPAVETAVRGFEMAARPDAGTTAPRPDASPGPRYAPPAERRATDEIRPVPRRKGALRRVKRTLRHVDPISVFKLSLFFSAALLIVWLLLVAIVYWIADARGLFDVIDELRTGFALDWQGDITLFVVEKWAFLIGFTLAVASSLLSLFLAFVYNMAADFVGGAETTWVERDT